MKPVFFLIFITSMVVAQRPSQYHVVRVVGKVESPALQRELKTGDVIQSKDQLRFSTRESYIIVNSAQTGRKRISGVPDSAPREFLQLLQSFVQPELRSTSTRNIALQYLESLQNSMAFDTLLILGDGFIPINTQKLSLTKPAVIRAWHNDGTKTAGKKLIYKTISNDKGITISQAMYDEVYTGPLPLTTPKVSVEYFESESEDPLFSVGILLGAFVPMWADEQQLQGELKALIGALSKTKTKAEILTEINNYLREEYAPAQEENLKAWLKAKAIITE